MKVINRKTKQEIDVAEPHFIQVLSRQGWDEVEADIVDEPVKIKPKVKPPVSKKTLRPIVNKLRGKGSV